MSDVTPDFQDKKGWRKYVKIGHVTHRTQSYTRWNDMKKRCRKGMEPNWKWLTYADTEMSTEFQDYQKFVPWHMAQIGYGFDKYHIDKDLILPGNRVYGPDTCVLLPAALNQFICVKRNFGAALPTGVYMLRGRFCGSMNVDGKTIYLGLFPSAESAHEAYVERKDLEARKWYERALSGEIVIDPRATEALRTWSTKERVEHGNP